MDARSSSGLGYGPVSAPVQSRAAWPPKSEGPLWVEVRRAGEMRAVADAWRQLLAHALEPSVFAEPDFLLPALQHIPEGRHVAVLCVWQGPPQYGVLRGLFPVVGPRLSVAARDIRIWQPPFSSANAALIDGGTAEAVLEAALAELADRGAAAGLLFSQVPLQGPFAAALQALARRTQRPLDVLGPNEESVDGPWPADSAGDGSGLPLAPDRLQRLSALGEVRIERTQEPRPVRDAVEEFFVLEASAQGGSALIQDVGTASFVRTMTRELARSRRCRVDVVRVDGKAVAAAIVLKSARCVWLWKIACDERFAPCAPDALLALELARTRRKQTRLELGDACGLHDHPMLRSLWRERMIRGDLLIAVRPGLSPRARPLQASHRMVRSIRWIAQQAYAGLTRKRALMP